MSAEAVGWVYRHSPYTGVTFQVHHAIADSVNDQNGNEFWLTKVKCAAKARATTKSVQRSLATLVEGGYLEVVYESVGREASRYRFLYPDVPVVFESRWTATGTPRPGRQRGHGVPPTGTSGVANGDMVSLQRGHLGSEIAPYKEGTQGDPNISQGKGATARQQRLPDQFLVSATMQAWAEDQWQNVDWKAQTEQFADYHRSKGTTMIDWTAAWRTWIRNAGTRFAPRGQNSNGTPMAKVDQRTVQALEWARREDAKK